MEEYEKVQPPLGAPPQGAAPNPIIEGSPVIYQVFPYPDSIARLRDYEYYNKLFMGDHFSAFRIRIDDIRYNRDYAKLRYVMVNFAGLLSKIIADMLFSEPIVIKTPDGDQEFIEALWKENKMDVQCYESALSNSSLGDALFKVRVGKRYPNDTESTVIIEDITPRIYFPKINGFNVREEPEVKELAWTFKKGDNFYLRQEIHHFGWLENKVFLMQGEKIVKEENLSILGINSLVPMVDTGIDRSLIIHAPNWKTGDRHFGISDFYDLDTIFYAINNRVSKVDNVLDKHGDPILMVPPGVMDEKGHVNKKALGVMEIADGENNKPEYIVWDASLDNAFKQIEKLVEFMYLIGEISPDILGVGQGVSDSGRALKFKLMRTIAKTARKKLYYDLALKEALYVAQLLAKKWNLKVNGLALKGEPVVPEIEWADGLPIDIGEQIDTESKAIDAGLTSKKAAMMRVYGVDEMAAEKTMKDMKGEMDVMVPKVNPAPDFKGNKVK